MKHDLLLINEPMQDLPPYFGVGAAQLLYRFRFPVPQVLLQEPHVTQLDQPPCTGQWYFMHDFDWIHEPMQDLPPYVGVGAVQLLYRNRFVFPQLLLQEPHAPQLDQPPCTVVKRERVKRD